MKTTLDAIGLVVADMARSLDFYRRLGLDIPAEADGESHVSIELPSGLRLMWDSIEVLRSFDPEWTVPTGGPGTSLAFLCASPSDVDRMYAELVNAGFEGHRGPWDAFWGQRYATLRDPDGNGIDLFAPLEDGSPEG